MLIPAHALALPPLPAHLAGSGGKAKVTAERKIIDSCLALTCIYNAARTITASFAPSLDCWTFCYALCANHPDASTANQHFSTEVIVQYANIPTPFWCWTSLRPSRRYGSPSVLPLCHRWNVQQLYLLAPAISPQRHCQNSEAIWPDSPHVATRL